MIAKILCASTGDVTEGDHKLLEERAANEILRRSNHLDRIISSEYGWLVYVVDSKPQDFVEERLQGYKDAGFSDSFVRLYQKAVEEGVLLIELDADNVEIFYEPDMASA